MNPHKNEIPAMQLPAPMEQAPNQAAPTGTPESAPAAAEQAPSAPSAASQALPVPSTVQLPVAAPTAVGQTTPAAAPTTNLQVKDDGDLIEKEWVNKAKEIVERTHQDPYKQSEELTVFKADYMKKRYNKTIKISK